MTTASVFIAAPTSARDSDLDVIEMESVNCPLCGGGDHEAIVVGSDSSTGAMQTFCVVRCGNCSLAFTNPRPTEKCIGVFYPADYRPYDRKKADRLLKEAAAVSVVREPFPNNVPAAEDRTLGARIAQWVLDRRARRRLWWIPLRPPGRILDFGCGAGDFLQRMQKRGWRVEGIDVSAKMARAIETGAGIRVHVGSLPHPSVERQAFDVVTMWNALEHVHEPRKVVSAARDALRPGGLLVVGVPNFDSWSCARFQQDWHALDVPRHLCHFTPKTLCALLRAEQFEIVSVEQITPEGWLRKSAQRARTADRTSPLLHAVGWKPWGRLVARWTELIGRADYLRVSARKR